MAEWLHKTHSALPLLENETDNQEMRVIPNQLVIGKTAQGQQEWQVKSGSIEETENSTCSSWHNGNGRVIKEAEPISLEATPLYSSEFYVTPKETFRFSLEQYIKEPSTAESITVERSIERNSTQYEAADCKHLSSNLEGESSELVWFCEVEVSKALKSKDRSEINRVFNKYSKWDQKQFLIKLKKEGNSEDLEFLLKSMHSPSHNVKPTFSAHFDALDLASVPKHWTESVTPKLTFSRRFDTLDLAREPKHCHVPQYTSSIYLGSLDALDLAGESKTSKPTLPLNVDALALARVLENWSEPDTPQMLLASHFLIEKNYQRLEQKINDVLTRDQIKLLLKRASESGDLNSIKIILEASQIDINEPIDAAGNRVLHLAAQNCNFKAIDYLLELGASTELKNADDRTPLGSWTESLAQGSKGPFINVKTGETVFHEAVKYRCPHIVKHIVAQGVPVNYWLTPAEKVSEKGAQPNTSELGMAIESGDTEIIKILISSKNIKRDGFAARDLFPLGLAVETNNYELAKLLLASGFSANDDAFLGEKAVNLAAYLGHIEILKLLVELGADVNSESNYSFNPAVFAIQQSHYEAAVFLIQSGAKPLLRVPEDWSPFGEISSTENTQKKLRIDPLTGNEPIHDLLQLESGYELLSTSFLNQVKKWSTHENNEGFTAFDLAVKKGDTWLVSKMLKHAEIAKLINYPSMKTGKTPLMLAIEAKNTEMVKLLLESGANPNKYKKGMTPPLILAVNSGNPKLFKAMLVPGLNLNIQDLNGKTALHYAVESEGAVFVKLMFEFQDDHSFWSEYSEGNWYHQCFLLSQIKSNLGDKIGRLPLHYAIDARNKLVIRYLLHHGTDLDRPLEDKCPADQSSLLQNGANIYFKLEKGERSPLSYAIKSAPLDIITTMIEETAERYSLHDYRGKQFRLGYILDNRPGDFVKIAGLLKRHGMCFLDEVKTDEEEGKILAQTLSSGHIENVNWLLKNYSARFRKGLLLRKNNGQNLLHLATKIHGDHSIKPLLELIPIRYLYASDKDNMHPIHYAISHGNIKAVKELAEKMGANVFHKPSDNAKDSIGYAIHNAPLSIVEVMLDNAIKDPNLSGKKLQKFRLEYILKQRPDDFMVIAPMLMKCNACCVNSKGRLEGGEHILSSASLLGRFDIVNWMLQNFESESKTLLTIPNEQGQNLLHCAVINSQSNSLRPLTSLMPKTCLFELDNNGKLPIHYAIQRGNISAAKELIEQMGEQWNATDLLKFDVVAYATSWGQVELLKELERLNLLTSDVLTQSDINYSLHIQAVMSDSTEMIDYLIEHNYDFYTPANSQRETLSEMAIGSLKLKTWFKLRGINHKQKDSTQTSREIRVLGQQQLKGFTSKAANALEKAISENEKDITRELLFYIAEVMDLMTFTHWMISLGKLELIKLLKKIEIPEPLQSLKDEPNWILLARKHNQDKIAQWFHDEQSQLLA